jgi:hypothetical protein
VDDLRGCVLETNEVERRELRLLALLCLQQACRVEVRPDIAGVFSEVAEDLMRLTNSLDRPRRPYIVVNNDQVGQQPVNL